ncbi:MFS family permease [Cellulosimicrobium sp. 4261]
MRRWIVLCAMAEAVGMTASAAAARAGTALVTAGRSSVLAWTVAVLGGLVEGVALGLAQRAALTPVAPKLNRRRWLMVTVAVAGLGWVVGSAPSVLATDDGATAPGPVAALVGAAALGLAMGAVLGAAQSWVMRPAAQHAWRWVGISAAAWTPAMAVIFTGASVAPAEWPWGGVVLLGTATGAVAGAVLGAVCGALAPALTAPQPSPAVVRTEPKGSTGPRRTRSP